MAVPIAVGIAFAENSSHLFFDQRTGSEFMAYTDIPHFGLGDCRGISQFVSALRRELCVLCVK